ncbi:MULTISPECIES: ion channel [unclassified Ruegeria]|uniref:ion channel n=1 Tax=unclassified Ruegeria TaxID=2625375 RepID=UPI00149265F6|nr:MULTISPECIES: potassium channel family protein [unclassified Ruegeria]NOD78501.1 two pore domain potassium channel family protein [Ruegeria sp. HKCCD4332]UUV08583.1 potassium channel family protein [Ruegeria sp. YS9]
MVRNFLFNYLGLFRALAGALTDVRSLHLLAMSASLVFVSTSFYVLVEGWSILDAAYFSVVTMSTVGYGDIAPTTAMGKVFTMIFTVAGIGIFVATITTVASIFVGNFKVRK